jgi:hypothetical protein
VSCSGTRPRARACAGRDDADDEGGRAWTWCISGAVAWMSTSFGAQYHRLARRLGKLKALVAVAHSLLVVIYCVLRDRIPYRELGPDYFGPQETARRTRHHIHRLEQLGYAVTLTPKEAA